MRLVHHAAAAALLLATAGAIVAGGRAVSPPADEITIAPEDIPTDIPGVTGEADAGDDASAATPQPAPEDNPRPPGRSRAIDPEIVAPPATGEEPLERAAPRPPLSDLSLALPPKPKMPADWKGTPLFHPLATAAGIFEAMGYTVALSGVDVVMPDETCTDAAGKPWNCGMRARGAFRSFLRGRAPVCAVPPQGGRDTIAAPCHIGKQDIGAWLVANGWARAAKGGPYIKAEQVARKEHMGIFGAAPDLSGLPPPPPAETPPMVSPSPSILDLSGTAATPPDDPSTQQAFPPAPAR